MLCPILWSTFSRNRRGFRTWDQFHRIQGTCKGGQSHRIFFLSLIFMLEIYVQFCGQRFLETCEVSGPGSNSIESRGPVRDDQSRRIFFLSLIFKLDIYVQFCGQRSLETGEVSGPGNNSIEFGGPVRVANHMGFYFYR